jgi:hypothetical protein
MSKGVKVVVVIEVVAVKNVKLHLVVEVQLNSIRINLHLLNAVEDLLAWMLLVLVMLPCLILGMEVLVIQ